MKALLVASGIVIATLTLYAQTLEIREQYECSGEGPDGRYQITLTTERKGDNYFLSWDNGRIYGMGFRHYGYLVAALVPARTAGIAVVLYEIGINQLVGQWTDGSGTLFSESCVIGPKGVSAQLG